MTGRLPLELVTQVPIRIATQTLEHCNSNSLVNLLSRYCYHHATLFGEIMHDPIVNFIVLLLEERGIDCFRTNVDVYGVLPCLYPSYFRAPLDDSDSAMTTSSPQTNPFALLDEVLDPFSTQHRFFGHYHNLVNEYIEAGKASDIAVFLDNDKWQIRERLILRCRKSDFTFMQNAISAQMLDWACTDACRRAECTLLRE